MIGDCYKYKKQQKTNKILYHKKAIIAIIVTNCYFKNVECSHKITKNISWLHILMHVYIFRIFWSPGFFNLVKFTIYNNLST